MYETSENFPECVCPYCGDMFRNKQGRDAHHKTSHGFSIKGIQIECKVCGDSLRVAEWRIDRDDYITCSYECSGEMESKRLSDREITWGEKISQALVKDGTTYRYGKNWRKQRRKALERDGCECVECGADDIVHVHHIIPRRIIANQEDMTLEKDGNKLENLVSLCPKHHKAAEINVG